MCLLLHVDPKINKPTYVPSESRLGWSGWQYNVQWIWCESLHNKHCSHSLMTYKRTFYYKQVHIHMCACYIASVRCNTCRQCMVSVSHTGLTVHRCEPDKPTVHQWLDFYPSLFPHYGVMWPSCRDWQLNRHVSTHTEQTQTYSIYIFYTSSWLLFTHYTR